MYTLFYLFLMNEVNIYLLSLGGTEYIFDYQNFSKRLTTQLLPYIVDRFEFKLQRMYPPKKKSLPSKASTLDCPPG